MTLVELCVTVTVNTNTIQVRLTAHSSYSIINLLPAASLQLHFRDIPQYKSFRMRHFDCQLTNRKPP